jgi:hypothetical protein
MIIHCQHGEGNQAELLQVLNGKNLFSALYGTYAVALHELNDVLKASTPAGESKTPKSVATQEDGFKKVWKRKRDTTNKTTPTSKKATCTAVDTPQKEFATRNFFAPLRASDMDPDSPTPRSYHLRQQLLPNQVDHPQQT